MNACVRTTDGRLGGHETVEAPERLLSLDVLRGFVMLALACGSLAPTALARSFPGNPLCQFLARQCKHAPWLGCTFADLIQPMFLFIVGVALPWTHINRRRCDRTLIVKVVRRAVFFVLLGVLFELTKNGGAISFINVLAQIGLGYGFIVILARRPYPVQLLAVSVILIATWLAFALYPLPGSSAVEKRYCGSGSTVDLASGRLPGFFAHWNKHDNFAAAFDRRFLNLFPRSQPYIRQLGGYQTLNFIPSMATVLLGVMAGQLLLSTRTPSRKLSLLVASGLLCWESGLILSWTICPCVKRLWTPSWVLASSGGAFLTLAAFYWLIEVRRHRRWCLPLAGIGRKTLLLYGASGSIQCLKPLVPQTAAHSLFIFLESLQRESNTIAVLYGAIKVYGPLALTAMLVFLLWRMGGRIVGREPCVLKPVGKN
jgi:heparan-alpha-glucosaminide N-acetyltransferase